MDSQACAITSLAGTVGIVGTKNLTTTPTASLLGILLSLFLVQYAVVKVYRIFIYPIYISPLRLLPGPKDDQFLVGQLVKQFSSPSPIELYCKWSQQWPDAPFIRHFGIGNTETLLINSLQAHKDVLQTYCYSFVKPSFVSRLVCEIAGTGVFAAEGADHKKQRRLLANSFSLSNLKKILPVFKKKASGLLTVIESALDNGATGSVEVHSILTKTGLDIIGIAVLGVELNNLGSESPEMDFHRFYDRMMNQHGLSALITFINVVVPIRKLLPIEANLGFVRASEGVRRLLKEVIIDRIRSVNELDSARRDGKSETALDSRDILTYMIEERYTGDDAWTEDDILGHLMNFMSAGHETSATALTWAIFVMATKPDVQDKLRAEVTGAYKNNSDPDYIEIEHLGYLNNFIREVLRLYSPGVSAFRQATTDITIDGVRIPKGTTLVTCLAVMNLSPKIWGPTAMEFIPERWEDLQGDAASPYAFEPFINGPRVCIGRQFAMLEMKVLLMELVGNFRFAPSNQQDLRTSSFLIPA